MRDLIFKIMLLILAIVLLVMVIMLKIEGVDQGLRIEYLEELVLRGIISAP